VAQARNRSEPIQKSVPSRKPESFEKIGGRAVPRRSRNTSQKLNVERGTLNSERKSEESIS
jgi:hypothetical protein